jgi:hypothetical protein
MLYAILCYASEDVVCALSKEQDDAVRADISAVEEKYARAGKLGPVAQLLPTTAATTLRKVRGESVVIDGPFAETKEQFLDFRPGRGGRLRQGAVGGQPERRLLRDPAGEHHKHARFIRKMP